MHACFWRKVTKIPGDAKFTNDSRIIGALKNKQKVPCAHVGDGYFAIVDRKVYHHCVINCNASVFCKNLESTKSGQTSNAVDKLSTPCVKGKGAFGTVHSCVTKLQYSFMRKRIDFSDWKKHENLQKDQMIRLIQDEFSFSYKASRGNYHKNNIMMYISLFVFDKYADIYMPSFCFNCSELLDYATGPISTFNLIDIMVQTSNSIAHIHSLGIYHRDIKLANYLRHPQTGRIYLIDFGFATSKQTDKLYIGTPYCMAPEIGRQTYVCESVDLFALAMNVIQSSILKQILYTNYLKVNMETLLSQIRKVKIALELKKFKSSISSLFCRMIQIEMNRISAKTAHAEWKIIHESFLSRG